MRKLLLKVKGDHTRSPIRPNPSLEFHVKRTPHINKEDVDTIKLKKIILLQLLGNIKLLTTKKLIT